MENTAHRLRHGRSRSTPVTAPPARLACCLLALTLAVGLAQARAQWPGVATSADGTPIAYEATGAGRVILVGHSMGGSVIAEAARLMPGRVMGLIGVDTLDNVEYPLTPDELAQMTAPLEKDFRTGSRAFIQDMISPKTDPRLREWILADVSAAPPAVALSAMNEMMAQYVSGEAARVFEQVRVPVVTVNGDLWPINFEANRRHMVSYDAIVLKDADHFLMMDRPEEFNRALEQAIRMISGRPDTAAGRTD